MANGCQHAGLRKAYLEEWIFIDQITEACCTYFLMNFFLVLSKP